MSSQSESLYRSCLTLNRILAEHTIGTVNAPRTVIAVDLALQRASAWATDQLPLAGQRGGSSSPQDIKDAMEATAVKRAAADALHRIQTLIRSIHANTTELYSLTQRYVETIDPKKAPTPLPGCKSCARIDGQPPHRLGGHFAPVYDKAKKHGLCRWCYEVQRATGQLPPIRACDTYHRVSPRAAAQLLRLQTTR